MSTAQDGASPPLQAEATRDELRELAARMDTRFSAVTTRDDMRELEARMDARFSAVTSRFARLEQRLAQLETAATLDTKAVAEVTAAVMAALLVTQRTGDC
jgi:uncharacterized protein YhaN